MRTRSVVVASVVLLALALGAQWWLGRPDAPVLPLTQAPLTPVEENPLTGRTRVERSPESQRAAQAASEPGTAPAGGAPALALSPGFAPGSTAEATLAEVARQQRALGAGATGLVAGAAKATFAMDREGIQGAMRSKIPEIRDCYESWLKASPQLGGPLKIGFRITTSDAGVGLVDEIHLAEDGGMGHLAMEGCVLNVVQDLSFEGLPEGGSVTVNYPFRFSSSDAG